MKSVTCMAIPSNFCKQQLSIVDKLSQSHCSRRGTSTMGDFISARYSNKSAHGHHGYTAKVFNRRLKMLSPSDRNIALFLR